MKEGITSLDLVFLVKELKEKLTGGRIRGIKQIDKTFLFEIYKQERFFLKIILPTAIYATAVSQQAPETPPNFCMQLRKYLLNRTISDIHQHEFDRIAILEIDGLKLMIELFSSGNIILTDNNGIIIALFEQQVWRDRILKLKTIYKYPPTNINPLKYDFFEFQKIISQMNKDIVRVLAVDMGFGGLYAEEICRRIEVDKNKSISQLNQQETDRLFRFLEQLKTIGVKPYLVMENKKQIDTIPFDLVGYQNYEKIQFESFNDALEAYFEGLEKVKREIKERKQSENMERKVERIQERQEVQLNELIEKEQKYRKNAQLLYEQYSIIDDIINGVIQLHENHKDWEKVKEIIKEKEIKLIKKLKPDEAKIVVIANGNEIELDFRKSVEENANYYFEQAKRMKHKIDALQEAMKKFELKPTVEKPAIVKPGKKWFERYRWFISSNNILVIAGKNARNNETIVKRYTRPQDLLMHADIYGSPFAVIRNDQKFQVLPPETIYESAELVATYSRVWEQKMATVAVYYVKPEQVVKESGLPLGSFVIKGERRWLEKIKPRLSIGIKQENVTQIKLVFGPPTAVKKQTPYMVTIVPGDKSAKELAQEIKKELITKVPYEIRNATENIDLEEIKKIIPYGRGELVR